MRVFSVTCAKSITSLFKLSQILSRQLIGSNDGPRSSECNSLFELLHRIEFVRKKTVNVYVTYFMIRSGGSVFSRVGKFYES